MNNDIISRKRLKRRIALTIFHKGIITVGELEELINNAPAVEETVMVDKSNFLKKQYNADLQTAYDCGYAQGYIDGSTGADWKGGAK